MNNKPNCPLHEALDMIDRLPNSWEWRIAHVSHVTGWTVSKLEAAIDRRYSDWCAEYGYDYT